MVSGKGYIFEIVDKPILNIIIKINFFFTQTKIFKQFLLPP